MSELAALTDKTPILKSGGLGTSPMTLLHRIPRALIRRWELRRAEKTLSEMPDHILKDIGLTRSQITSAVMHGRRPAR